MCHGVALVCCCLLSCFLVGDANGKLTFIHTYLNIKQFISKTVLFKSSSPNSFRFHRQISFPGKLKELTIQPVESISQRLDLTGLGLAKHCTKVKQTINLRT